MKALAITGKDLKVDDIVAVADGRKVNLDRTAAKAMK